MAASPGNTGLSPQVSPQPNLTTFATTANTNNANGTGNGAASRPNTSHSRPTTATSLAGTDPFASPFSSRPPSIRATQPPSPGSSKLSFPDSSKLSFPDLATNAAPRRSILVQSGFGTPAFNSARSSASRLSASAAALVGSPLANSHSGSGASTPQIPAQKIKATRMKSHMLNVAEGEKLPKPWLDKPNPRAKFSYWIVWITIFIGIAGGAVQCYFTYTRVPLDRRPLCLSFEETFDDNNEARVFGEGGSFFREVNMDGFGNGEFGMTTASTNNSFIRDGMLYIVPTLTADNIGTDAVFDGTIYNITGCTFNQTAPDNGFIIDQMGQRVFDEASYLSSCSAVSNRTAGTVINPVQSARMSTRYSASLRYGRVEVRAKMPNGDWLWPAIWMLPKDEVYGPWPRSGEIDIVESRGNGIRYTARGSNYVQGSLNWGPTPELNGVSKSYSWWTEKRKSFASGFHTYALEWTPDFLRIYVDTRLHTLLDFRFNKPFFQRGDFPDTIFNGSSLVPLGNPWINGTNATPFDQDFYLILNVAVGATSGWFPDFQGDKPWLDRAQSPQRDFAKNIAQWYPTWPQKVEDRAMIVDSVKMWKHC
ncbi:ectomycorrhiza-upregulated GH16 glucan endo-1,3-beta-glucosidase precursor [Panaeolus papilionaceus]|nr:ectomycorrhiza-upregulated GH16 glucan endo-1,3-beta-glucosidase precursor [Panaeolus papilionaceus]